MAIERVNVLGVGISVINLQTALTAIGDAVRARRKGYICVTGVHGVMEAQVDATLRRILNQAFLCTPDGMPMVWMGWLRGHREMSRVYGPDLMLEVCAWSEKSGCRHFFFGGAPGVAEQLRDNLTKRFPNLQVVGCYTPPFRALDTRGANAIAGNDSGITTGHPVGRLEHAETGKIHGRIFAAAGRDADDWRWRGIRFSQRARSNRRRVGCSGPGWSGSFACARNRDGWRNGIYGTIRYSWSKLPGSFAG